MTKWHVLTYDDYGPPEEKVIYLLQIHSSLVYRDNFFKIVNIFFVKYFIEKI